MAVACSVCRAGSRFYNVYGWRGGKAEESGIIDSGLPGSFARAFLVKGECSCRRSIVGTGDNKDRFTSVIRSESPFFELNLSELWQYRDLILLLVRRDLTALYKQTVLGPVWFFLQPLLTSLVYAVVFGVLARIPTDGVPFVLFYMSGIVLWTYFVGCLMRTSDTFAGNAYLFSKVYFPRLVMPVSALITNMITFSAQFCLFVVLVLFYAWNGSSVRPNGWVLIAPLLIIQTGLLGVGGRAGGGGTLYTVQGFCLRPHLRTSVVDVSVAHRLSHVSDPRALAMDLFSQSHGGNRGTLPLRLSWIGHDPDVMRSGESRGNPFYPASCRIPLQESGTDFYRYRMKVETANRVKGI